MSCVFDMNNTMMSHSHLFITLLAAFPVSRILSTPTTRLCVTRVSCTRSHVLQVEEGLLQRADAVIATAMLGHVEAGLAAARDGSLLPDLAQAYADAMAGADAASAVVINDLVRRQVTLLLQVCHLMFSSLRVPVFCLMHYQF